MPELCSLRFLLKLFGVAQHSRDPWLLIRIARREPIKRKRGGNGRYCDIEASLSEIVIVSNLRSMGVVVGDS